MSGENGKAKIMDELSAIFEAASGIDLREYSSEDNFFDIGMDSLILTQASIQIERRFNVKVGFRSLLEELSNISMLSEYLANHSKEFSAQPLASTPWLSDKDQSATSAPSGSAQQVHAPRPASDTFTAGPWKPVEIAAGGISSMVQLFQTQLAILQRLAQNPGSMDSQDLFGHNLGNPASAGSIAPSADPTAKPFGAIARISKDASHMSPRQKEFFDDFVPKYTKKTAGSRQHTQHYRSTHADPRVVTGFKPHLKEIVYPLVMNKSKGAQLWDIDGNRYIDLTCGFGSNFFGNMPDWLEEKLILQLKTGVEIGPQHELAGIVSQKLTSYIGHDRVAFCNTGSEAILGAIRIARTVTGRDKIVTFIGSYHGINDEVIVRATKHGKTLPAAPGIMPNSVVQTMVLDYGADVSLNVIREQSQNIAAVLVESVQSRRPEFRPAAFIKELRKICDEKGIVLVMDEIITGFRKGRYGAQGYYGIKGDLATYGKVIGGGIAVGVIAGKKKFMDALDGGSWTFGDSSIPEVGVTYFAGTFVRHPFALAAMNAVLDFLRSQPEDPATKLDQRADHYVARVNAIFTKYNAPWQYANFGSMMKLNASEEFSNLELLIYLLRYKGVHTWDGFPNFLTIAHTDKDIEFLVNAFDEAVRELKDAGFLGPAVQSGAQTPAGSEHQGDVKTGKNETGGVARFRPDPLNPGAYIRVD